MPFELYDKVFYTGELREYQYRLWTITNIDPLPPTNQYSYRLEAVDQDMPDAVWETNRAELLQLAYHGAPKFKFNEKVYHFFDNDYVAGVIQLVEPSLNNSQNIYEVIFENGEERTLQESQLFQFDPTKLLDSTRTTQDHVRKVRENIGRIVSDLIARGEVHDASKYRNPEKVLLDAIEYINVNDGHAPYGSEQYKRNTAILKPMLKHHYEHNTHHPEHYYNGVMDMTLMDIVELFCDWQAASVRNKDPEMNITHASERYCIDVQLRRIFENTARELGFKYK